MSLGFLASATTTFFFSLQRAATWINGGFSRVMGCLERAGRARRHLLDLERGQLPALSVCVLGRVAPVPVRQDALCLLRKSGYPPSPPRHRICADQQVRLI